MVWALSSESSSEIARKWRMPEPTTWNGSTISSHRVMMPRANGRMIVTKQTGCVHANGRSNFVSTAHSANHGILDPKADHVQGIANQVRVRNTRQYLTEAVMAAGFFCSAPPGVYGQLAAQAVQPEGKTAVSTDRRYRYFILLFSLILLFQMGRICAQKGLLSARKGACMGL